MLYDITLCLGENCPIKQSCYRFTAKVFGRKDVFAYPPYNFSNNCCEYFICNRPSETKIRLRAYEIWQQMGCQDGKSMQHWLQAETELSNI
jgi:hypothetical protein